MKEVGKLPENAQRVIVLGSSGSGKSVLSRAIGSALQLPVVHLDLLFWQPGWVQTEREAFRQQVEQIASEECWIIDGNYHRTLEARLKRADAVVYLDMPRWLCVWRVLRRHGQKRADLNEALEEKRDLEFLKFLWDIWRFPKTRGVRLRNLLEGYQTPVVWISSQKQVDMFLRSLQHS